MQQIDPYAALLAHCQFVLWRFETRGGKPTKVPCDVTGMRRVSITNAYNYLDYATATAAARETGLGVGFALTDNDPFFLLDIDGCKSPDGSWAEIATTLGQHFAGALVERSVSGAGLHIIGSYTSMPEHGHKNGKFGLEFYHTERFIALGDAPTAMGSASFNCDSQLPSTLDTYFPHTTVHEHAAEWTDTAVDGWGGPEDDEALIALARRSRPAASAFTVRASFSDLYDENIEVLTQAYPSSNGDVYDRSAADLALAAKLAFYTGHNCERVAAIMQGSALVRDKWQRDEYIQGTILKSSSDRTQFYGKKITSAHTEICEDEIERIRGLIEADAGNLTRLRPLLAEINKIGDPLIKEGAVSQLKQCLREAKLYTGKLGKEIDLAINQLKPKRQAGEMPSEGQVLGPDVEMSPMLWKHTKGKELKPKGTSANFNVLMDSYGASVVFDEILKEATITYPKQHGGVLKDEAAVGHLESLANLNEFPTTAIAPGLSQRAHDNTFNPVREWIEATPWDGQDRTPEFMSALTLAPEEDRVMASILVHKWLRAAVAIGLGIARKMEYVLVFVDPKGGAGKTRFINTLAPAELVKDSLTLDLSNKDSIKIATSCWLAELGELDSTFRRSDQKRIMAFLSSHVDEMRMPYGRTYNKYPRRTAFMGTVNTTEFLVDNSSNRRWWPVRVSHLDHTHTINVQQLWAQMHNEVVHQRLSWYLDDAESGMLEEHNDTFRSHSRVIESLMVKVPSVGECTDHRTVTEIMVACGYHGATKSDLNEAAAWLRSKGYERVKRSGKVGYLIPPAAAAVFQPTLVQGCK